MEEHRNANSQSEEKPIVSFDTSALNKFLSLSTSNPLLISKIRTRFHVRLVGLSIEEIIATPDNVKRMALLDCCEALTLENETSDYLLPQNALIEALIRNHRANPATFDWRRVSVSTTSYAGELRRREFVCDDALAQVQKLQQAQLQKAFRKQYLDIRSPIDAILKAGSYPRPTTFRDALLLYQAGPRKATISTGKRIYELIVGTSVTRQTVRQFMARCPPFLALVFAHLMSEYDLSMSDRAAGERFKAGRNDMYMSVYLPYCHYYVTAESRGEQERCLTELAVVSGLHTVVMSYTAFASNVFPENQ